MHPSHWHGEDRHNGAPEPLSSSQREYLSNNGVCYAKTAPGEPNCRSLAAAFTSLGNRDDYKLKYGLTEPEQFAHWRQKLLGEIRDEITTERNRCHTYTSSRRSTSPQKSSETRT